MNTLLDRYLALQFVKNLLLVLFALISIYFLVDFFERIDNFLEQQKSMGLALRYFMLKVPFMVDMLQPVCLLLAGVITLGLMYHNHEYMALKAGGISIMRITRPLLLCAVVGTLLALCMAQWILPTALAETNRIWHEEVNHQAPKGVVRQGRFFHHGEEGIYSFIRPNAESNEYHSFSYISWDKNYTVKLHLQAENAYYQDGLWNLVNGQVRKRTTDSSGEPVFEVFDEAIFSLPEGPEDFFVPAYKSDEKTISQLYHEMRQNPSASDQAKIAFHSRLSFVFLGIPLVLIGLPVLLAVHRKWGHDLTLAIPISCGIAFAVWSIWSTAQSMAKAEYLPAVAAAWGIHLLISPLGYWLLKKQDI